MQLNRKIGMVIHTTSKIWYLEAFGGAIMVARGDVISLYNWGAKETQKPQNHQGSRCFFRN